MPSQAVPRFFLAMSRICPTNRPDANPRGSRKIMGQLRSPQQNLISGRRVSPAGFLESGSGHPACYSFRKTRECLQCCRGWVCYPAYRGAEMHEPPLTQPSGGFCDPSRLQLALAKCGSLRSEQIRSLPLPALLKAEWLANAAKYRDQLQSQAGISECWVRFTARLTSRES
jgi:hypothetical protein